MPLTKWGDHLFNRPQQGFTAQSFSVRVDRAMHAGPFARNVMVFREEELNTKDPYSAYREIHAIYRLSSGEFILRRAKVYYHNGLHDSKEDHSLPEREARLLYGYLDDALHGTAEFPNYRSLVEWGKRMFRAWENGDDDAQGDLLEPFIREFLIETQDYSDEALDDDPEDVVVNATFDEDRDHWATEALKRTPFPPPTYPELGQNQEATITQDVFVEINGKKIKGKRRVLTIDQKIEEIGGE